MNAIMRRRRELLDQIGGGGGERLIYSYDFTESLADSINRAEATLSGSASRDSGGLHITGENGYCLMPDALNTPHVRVEVDVAESDAQFAYKNTRYFLSISNTAGYGVAYNSYNQYWTNYFYNPQGDSRVSDANAFSRHTMKFEYDANNHSATLKMDNTTLLETTNINPWWTPVPTGWKIGGGSDAFFSVTVTAVRIYDLGTA